MLDFQSLEINKSISFRMKRRHKFQGKFYKEYLKVKVEIEFIFM